MILAALVESARDDRRELTRNESTDGIERTEL